MPRRCDQIGRVEPSAPRAAIKGQVTRGGGKLRLYSPTELRRIIAFSPEQAVSCVHVRRLQELGR